MPLNPAPESEYIRPSQRYTRTVQFLSALLPNDPGVFDAALQNSRDALELADRWLRLECRGVLSKGAPQPDPGAPAPRLEDFSVASLLCLPTDAGQWYGLDAIKALVLVDRFTERQEADLVSTLVDGLKKSAHNRSNWRKVLPPHQGGDIGLLEAVVSCQACASELLNQPKGLGAAQLKWLEALERWCELLKTPSRKFKWILDPAPPLDEPTSTTIKVEPKDDDDEGGARPSISLIDLDPVDDPSRPESEPGEWPEPELPTKIAPEAPATNPRAEPDHEGDLETLGGGEARRARTGFRSALENQRLRWINDQLVPRDVSDLVGAIREALAERPASAESSDQDAAGLVGLAMVFGTLIEELLLWPLAPSEGTSCFDGPGTLSRLVPRQPDAWSPDTRQAALLRPATDCLRLSLPEELRVWLSRIFDRHAGQTLGQALELDPLAAVERVRLWLTSLRSKTTGGQTLGRVERWLACALYQECRDHVQAHLLYASPEAPPCPAAYYRAYEAGSLEDLHLRTLGAAGWTMKAGGAPTMPTPETAWVGSRLNPEPDVVCELWKTTRTRLVAVVSDTNQSLRERHNAREIHEVFSSIFQTFHRIVSDPIESLELLDLAHARIIIDDKRQGDARAHRLVPLTERATSDCKEHVEHLWRLASALQSRAPETSARIVTMLTDPSSRASPFRFLLNEKLQIVRITPALLLDAFREHWPLPLNLARHMGATWLLQAGASDRQVCSLLGHHDLGTLDLSPLSPVEFEALFGDLRPKLDEFVKALGLDSIPSFLPPVATRPVIPPMVARPTPMQFGYQRREARRAKLISLVRARASDWIAEQLAGRKAPELTQGDVDALFEKARRSTANGRTHWARQRFEVMRELLAESMREHPDMKVELPALAITVRDVAHICPMDGLTAGRWLEQLRTQLNAYWAQEFAEWRKAQLKKDPKPYVPGAPTVALALMVESLVIDPDVWRCWFDHRPIPSAFIDQAGRSWLRMALPNGNTRLYPLRRDIAELISGVPAAEWQALKPRDIVDWVRDATDDFRPAQPLPDVWQMLNRVQSALAPDVPGVVLGFADGSHRGVSPEEMCLERADARGPTVDSVNAWKAQRKATEAVAESAGCDGGEAATKGQLQDLSAFRRSMSAALALLENRRGKRSKGQDGHKSASIEKQADTAPETKDRRSTGGPIRRFREHLEAQWEDLVGSLALPPMCALTVRWMHTLAETGQRSGEDYAPKTFKNYWYSWALRLIEEFGPLDPREMSTAELEELYLQIVEDAEVDNRQHLYPPMRNLHRYLVENHGVCEIEWSELRHATGHGLTRVDANLIHRHEYLRALTLLCNDEAVSPRVRVMQAVVLLLVYRCGLRIAEALGLRDTDIYRYGDRWHVRVAGNQFRGLKTDNARRTVPIVEPLSLEEEQLLAAWSDHVTMFATGRDIRPLFSVGAAGLDRRELFPRRTIALRIAQALRISTGDPTTRVHHCRHAFATRVLGIALGLAHPAIDVEAEAEAVAEAEAESIAMVDLLALLTSEEAPTRRAVWAVAALLGHASPMTTLETYFHAGHELLLDWCARRHWTDQPKVDPVEWHVFAAGIKLKTMQRARQRADGQLDLATSQSEWTLLRRCAVGTRVELGGRLPSIPQRAVHDSLVNVDRIIDHARRFGRVDGLSDRLFVEESWIETVLLTADQFARRRAGPDVVEGFCWTESPATVYKNHEIDQIEDVLQAVERAREIDLGPFASVVDRSLVPRADMLSIEDTDDLDAVAEVVSLFVFEKEHIEVLLPADSDLRRPLPAMSRPPVKATETSSPSKPGAAKADTKPRFKHVAAAHLQAAAKIAEHARSLGFTTDAHDRVAGARESRHSNQAMSDRIGLRVARKAGERTRSAKVFTRVASAITVAVLAAGVPASPISLR